MLLREMTFSVFVFYSKAKTFHLSLSASCITTVENKLAIHSNELKLLQTIFPSKALPFSCKIITKVQTCPEFGRDLQHLRFVMNCVMGSVICLGVGHEVVPVADHGVVHEVCHGVHVGVGSLPNTFLFKCLKLRLLSLKSHPLCLNQRAAKAASKYY